MPCYHPKKAWKPCSKNNPDQRPKFGDFPPSNRWAYSAIKLPCGACIGCRLDKASEWGARIMQESQFHKFNAFLTLTIDDENMNDKHEVSPRDLQLFMKKLRKWVKKKHGVNVRFVAVGEYGDQTKRAHYHVCLFGECFMEDRKECEKSHTGHRQWVSETLTKLWGKGNCKIGAITPESAEYVGRHNIKKVNGEKAKEHYRYQLPITGEIVDRLPEFIRMSNRPGIGRGYFEQNKETLKKRDSVIVKGRERRVPKYYDKLLKREDPETLEAIKAKRKARARKPENKKNSTPERLLVREIVRKSKLAMLARPV